VAVEDLGAEVPEVEALEEVEMVLVMEDLVGAVEVLVIKPLVRVQVEEEDSEEVPGYVTQLWRQFVMVAVEVLESAKLILGIREEEVVEAVEEFLQGTAGR